MGCRKLRAPPTRSNLKECYLLRTFSLGVRIYFKALLYTYAVLQSVLVLVHTFLFNHVLDPASMHDASSKSKRALGEMINLLGSSTGVGKNHFQEASDVFSATVRFPSRNTSSNNDDESGSSHSVLAAEYAVRDAGYEYDKRNHALQSNLSRLLTNRKIHEDAIKQFSPERKKINNWNPVGIRRSNDVVASSTSDYRTQLENRFENTTWLRYH
jgi:hypothetical protein